MSEEYRTELIRDLRTTIPDSSLCNAAADEIEELEAIIERMVDDKDALRVVIDALITIQEEASNALDAMTCAGKGK